MVKWYINYVNSLASGISWKNVICLPLQIVETFPVEPIEQTRKYSQSRHWSLLGRPYHP